MTRIIPSVIKFLNTASPVGSSTPPAYSSTYTDTTKITDGNPQDATTYEQSNDSSSIVIYFKFPAGTFLSGKNIGFTVTNTTSNRATAVDIQGWSSAYLWGSPDGTTWGGSQYPCTSNNTGSILVTGTVLVNAGTFGPSELINAVNYQYLALVVNSSSGTAGVAVSDVRIFSATTGTYIGAQNFQIFRNQNILSLPPNFLTNESAGSGIALYQDNFQVGSSSSSPINGIVINSTDGGGYPTSISASRSSKQNTNQNLVVSGPSGVYQTSWFDVVGTVSSNLTIPTTTTGVVSQSKTTYKQISASTLVFPNISFPKNYSKAVSVSVSSNVSQFKRTTKQISSVSNTNPSVVQSSNLTKKPRKKTFITVM